MSSLNFLVQEEFALVSTDTLAVNPDTRLPSHFQSKAFPVLHLNGLICGTGINQLIIQWYSIVATSMLARSISHLDEYAPSSLRELASELKLPKEITSTIYHFGYDDYEKRFRVYAYRSVHDFQSEELCLGFGVKPQVEFTQSENPIKDFIDLITLQREDDLSKPVKERIGIGGDIHVYALVPGSINIKIIHRFDDYEDLYSEMCSYLLSNK